MLAKHSKENAFFNAAQLKRMGNKSAPKLRERSPPPPHPPVGVVYDLEPAKPVLFPPRPPNSGRRVVGDSRRAAPLRIRDKVLIYKEGKKPSGGAGAGAGELKVRKLRRAVRQSVI